MIAVYIAGEGSNELGTYAREPAYADGSEPGVIETLLRRVASEGWEVGGGFKWASFRKYRARGPTPGDAHAVDALVHEAHRAQVPCVAFLRDRDDDEERVRVIHKAIEEARGKFPRVEIIGGVPVPVLEAWILAMRGKTKTETLGKAAAQKALVREGVPEKSTAAMVEVARDARLDALPEDAKSLRAWLERAREVLPALIRDAPRSGPEPEMRAEYDLRGGRPNPYLERLGAAGTERKAPEPTAPPSPSSSRGSP